MPFNLPPSGCGSDAERGGDGEVLDLQRAVVGVGDRAGEDGGLGEGGGFGAEVELEIEDGRRG